MATTETLQRQEQAQEEALERPVARGGQSQRKVLSRIIIYVLLVLFSLFIFVPLAFMISTSLKAEGQLFAYPIQWIPDPVMWENYPQAFRELGRIAPDLTFWRIMGNTLFITLLAMVAELIAVSLVAYGFARFRFPGRDVLFIILLGTMMLPGIVTLIPTFLIWRNLGLIDSYDPLTLVAWFGGGAWAIFMLRQFYLTIPVEMEEAAFIDGANTFQIYYMIMLPLIKPALLALGVFVFQGNWNNFQGPLIYLNTTALFPLVLALRFFQESLSQEAPKWHYMMAMSVVMAAPILLLYFVAQRYFLEGLQIGAIKG